MTTTFHRLATPSYFIPGGGPLPTGYDYLNSPVAGGSGSGIASPADTNAKSGGTYDGSYFIVDLESANAFDLNRPAAAIGLNTDTLDNKFQRAAVVAAVILSRTSTTETFFTVTSNHLISNALFSIVTPTGGPLFVNGVRVVVSSTTGSVDSDGFFVTNVTLTYNVSIPSGIAYVVLGGTRSTFAAVDNYSSALSLSWNSSIADDVSGKFRYDFDVVTVSDNATSTGGDYNAADITALINGTTAQTNWSLRPGTYKVSATDSWVQGNRIVAAQPGTAKIVVDSSRASDVDMAAVIGGVEIIDCSVDSQSILGGHFVAQCDFAFKNSAALVSVGAGSLELSGSATTVSHQISGMRVATNTTLTLATAAFKVSGSAHLDMLNSTVTALPTGSTPPAYMLFDTYTGTAHVRNCVFGNNGAAIGLYLTGVTGTGSKIIFENCVIQATGTSNVAALHLLNSTGLVFRNCYIYSEIGQALRGVNSGALFERCIFASGTNTSATTPQLIAGEGNVTGARTEALHFVDCIAIYGAANVRATGAPTKAIVELGGRDSTLNIGLTKVDGLLVTPSSSSLAVHNYTTVLLHGGAAGSGAPNQFNGVTIDMLGCVPTASGTLGQFMGGFNGNGLIVEVVGSTNTPKTKCRDLRILNVGWPATAIGRGVLGSLSADIDGLVVDGSAPGAGSYTGQLIDLRVGRATGIDLFPTAGLLSSNSTVGVMSVGFAFQASKVRYHHRSSGAVLAGPIIAVSGGIMEDAVVLVDQSITSANPLFRMGDDRSAMRRCYFFVDGNSAGEMLKADNIVESELIDCTFIWKNTADDQIADLNTFTDGRCIGNMFAAATTHLPTVDYANTTGIPSTADFATLNAIRVSVLATAPTVY